MLAHNLLDGLGSLVGVVKGDRADIVVQDVGLNDTMEQVAADKTKLAIDRGGGTSDEVPLLGGVVRKRGVSVLKECNGNCGISGEWLARMLSHYRFSSSC